MEKLELRFDSRDGISELVLDDGRYTFGRGSDAEFRFSDDGLSRIHATVYSEDGNVWIVDENSSNGTFVNGSKVGASGTPLKSGDSIKIGHYTNILVVEGDEEPVETQSPVASTSSASATQPEGAPSLLVPLSILGIAALLIVGSIGIVAAAVLLGSDDEVAENPRRSPYEEDFREDELDSPTPEITTESTPVNSGGTPTTDSTPTQTELDTNQSPGGQSFPDLPKKQYQQMTDSEKNLYIKVKAERVARLIGNRSTGDIPAGAVRSIRRDVEGYIRRMRSTRVDDCRSRNTFGRSDFLTVLERASKNVPFIQRSFRSQAMDPQIGIYVAMIESEHCVCLQSPTGPLGMFQFTRATGASFGLQTKSGASPQNPDERCMPEPASKAAAKYLKYLSGRIGTGPLSIPLAIASYNSGEGLGRNLMTALKAEKGEERSFWTLVANAEKLSKQFQHENIRYVPKFFAAAIVGENPRDFGANLQPLSTYSK